MTRPDTITGNYVVFARFERNEYSWFPALMLYLHTGVRAAEGQLRWKQVDFVRRTITVGKSKTYMEAGYSDM